MDDLKYKIYDRQGKYAHMLMLLSNADMKYCQFLQQKLWNLDTKREHNQIITNNYVRNEYQWGHLSN